MIRFILRRLIYAIPVLLGIILLVFILARVIPGDPCTATYGEKATPELCAQFAIRYGLGLDTPWYVAELTATGFVRLPALAIAVGWLAAAGQVTALSIGRYAPYPSARERPPRGPLREAVRRTVLTVSAARARRASEARRAQEG